MYTQLVNRHIDIDTHAPAPAHYQTRILDRNRRLYFIMFALNMAKVISSRFKEKTKRRHFYCFDKANFGAYIPHLHSSIMISAIFFSPALITVWDFHKCHFWRMNFFSSVTLPWLAFIFCGVRMWVCVCLLTKYFHIFAILWSGLISKALIIDTGQ